MAVVINGMTGEKSPNIGLIVKVKQLVYECPQLGRIWRCEAEYAQRALNPADRPFVPLGLVDFAQDWLRKIDPPSPTQTTTTDKEITA